MKYLIAIFFLGFIVLTSFTSNQKPKDSVKMNFECDSVPVLNKKILDYVNSEMGKKVDRGECWDLAANALNTVGARWDKKLIYGRMIDYKNECIFPGDIIQFEGVKTSYEKDNLIYQESMQHHTAIVYQVKDHWSLILAHQNAAATGRKVGLSPFEIKNITKGKIKVYRPVAD